MATPGIHNIDTDIRNNIKNIAHPGHSCSSVFPFSGTQAGYPLPLTIISMKLAVNIRIIAKGDRYFQHICQYKLGRDPIISSMSSENLHNERRKKKTTYNIKFSNIISTTSVICKLMADLFTP